jgi:AcrR family transcriptional regulator
VTGIVTAMSRSAPDQHPDGDHAPVPRIGRPRASGSPAHFRAPRDEIVAAATQLFADNGFDQTTMSEIARAAGLQQSSLYYWFKRKELILQAVFAVNRTPLEFIERIGAGSGSPALKLYRLIRFDTIQLCESPCDVLEVGRLAARQSELFADYWRDRQRLHDWVVSLLRAGIDEGELVDVDPDLAALGLLSLDEGIQHWIRHGDQHRPSSASPFRFPRFTALEAGDFAAATALRSLLRRADTLAVLQSKAATFDDLAGL